VLPFGLGSGERPQRDLILVHRHRREAGDGEDERGKQHTATADGRANRSLLNIAYLP
jgi:hypothetical protein